MLPTSSYLADALEAFLANKQPLVAATEAPGCTLDLIDQASADVGITYHNRISRIVQTNCVECHRDGGVAPFALTTHADVTAHAAMIKQVVEAGTMPPWFAESPTRTGAENGIPDCGPTTAHWPTPRSKTCLLGSMAANKQGDERDARSPVLSRRAGSSANRMPCSSFQQQCQSRPPGTMPYQNIVIETNLDEDKWVQAIEVQPGNRSVVHHMTIFLLSAEKERASSRGSGGRRAAHGFWAIYVPGNATLVYPDGFAKALPKMPNLRCQVHYTPNGTATTDLSRIGVVYAKQPPRHEVRVVGIGNPRMAIPPEPKTTARMVRSACRSTSRCSASCRTCTCGRKPAAIRAVQHQRRDPHAARHPALRLQLAVALSLLPTTEIITRRLDQIYGVVRQRREQSGSASSSTQLNRRHSQEFM